MEESGFGQQITGSGYGTLRETFLQRRVWVKAQVLEKYPLLLTETLGLSSEYALIGHINDLYDNILAADFQNNKVRKDNFFAVGSGLSVSVVNEIFYSKAGGLRRC
jgi:hypothetical protein